MTRAAIRHMLGRGSGDVVFVSSLAGRRVPRADGTVYAATKHALTAVAEGCRMDLHKGHKGNQSRARPRSNGVPGELVPERTSIAGAVLYAVEQPQRVSVNEILLRPTEQPK